MDFLYIGAHPALDLVNTWTVDRGEPVERLGDFDALLRWTRGAAVLDAVDREVALSRWAGHPDGAQVFERARALREGLRGWLHDRQTAPAIAQLVDAGLAVPAMARRVVPSGRGFVRARAIGDRGPDVLVGALAEAVADLLCDVAAGDIRRCQSRDCEAWFRVAGRTVVRVWCSDARCGGRHRAARYAKAAPTWQRHR
jgi:predicted RNA-binding Zn ribbon-like protein